MIERLRRFLKILRMSWELSAQPFDHPPVTPQGGFDFERNGFLADLMEKQQFVDVLHAIAAEQSRRQLEYLRATVRTGQRDEAIRAEAVAQVFDDLPQIFRNYAVRFRRDWD